MGEGISQASPLSDPGAPASGRRETPHQEAVPDLASSSGTATAAVTPTVEALVTAVSAVASVPAAELPGSVAVAEAAVLLQQLEVLRGVVLARVADVDTRQLHSLVDAPSTGTWLAAQQTSLTRTEVALARRLSSFPLLAAAVDDGVLCVAVAARIAGALAKLRRHVDRPDRLIDGQPAEETLHAVLVDGVLTALCQARGGLDDADPLLLALDAELQRIATSPAGELRRLEEGLVLLAQHVEQGELPGSLGMLVDALLPNELEPRAADQHHERGFGLRLEEDGSGWRITRGDLDLECGELLQVFLDAELAVDPDSPADTAGWARAREDGWQPGDDLPTGGAAGDAGPAGGCGRPRSIHQRRHDALRNGLRRYLDSGVAGLRDKVAPHVAVTVSLDALHDCPGALPPVAGSGARLPRSLVRRWWCDSAVTRFVMGLGHRVLETSHTERTLKAHERRVKRLETGGRCQAAGCAHGPGYRLVPHHPDPWARCGTTSLADTVLLCEQSHHDLHSGGHVLRLKDGRRLGPDGWVDPPGMRDAG